LVFLPLQKKKIGTLENRTILCLQTKKRGGRGLANKQQFQNEKERGRARENPGPALPFYLGRGWEKNWDLTRGNKGETRRGAVLRPSKKLPVCQSRGGEKGRLKVRVEETLGCQGLVSETAMRVFLLVGGRSGRGNHTRCWIHAPG